MNAKTLNKVLVSNHGVAEEPQHELHGSLCFGVDPDCEVNFNLFDVAEIFSRKP